MICRTPPSGDHSGAVSAACRGRGSMFAVALSAPLKMWWCFSLLCCRCLLLALVLWSRLLLFLGWRFRPFPFPNRRPGHSSQEQDRAKTYTTRGTSLEGSSLVPQQASSFAREGYMEMAKVRCFFVGSLLFHHACKSCMTLLIVASTVSVSRGTNMIPTPRADGA